MITWHLNHIYKTHMSLRLFMMFRDQVIHLNHFKPLQFKHVNILITVEEVD